MDYDIEYFETIDSTNTEARRRIEHDNPKRPLVLVAHEQTSGRGRLGRSFYSPKGSGVYMTVVRPVDCEISGQVTVTTRVSVAVATAIEEQFGIIPAIKWVNDIYINDRKCCGILCEAVSDSTSGRLRYIIIGIGINVNTADWPEDIASTAGSIANTPLDEPEFRRFAQLTAEKVLALTDDPADISYLEYYRSHSYVLGKDITFSENNVSFRARAVDISNIGGLMVQMYEDGKLQDSFKTLDSGEITVRIV